MDEVGGVIVEFDILTALLRFIAEGHNGLSFVDYCWNAIFGAIGAITAYLADTEGYVVLPHYDRERHTLELGGLGRALIGAGAGIAVGYNSYVPFLAGVIAPFVLPALINKALERFGAQK